MHSDLQYLNSHLAQYLKEFSDFLHFRSVSADPSCLSECKECAHFLVEQLKDIFSVELWEKPGHPPVICATYRNEDPNVPTLLLYSHYDVQPAHLSDGWLGDPFVMRIQDDRIIARGASDNKGQCFYTLKALQHYFQSRKGFPIHITWIIDGEEESDGVALQSLAIEKKEALRADYFLIVDGGFPSPQSPCVSIGARGIVTLKITLQEGDKDMHSGVFGGVAYNVNRALATMLASLHNQDHSVAVAGFYDDVCLPESVDPSDTEEAQFNFCPTLYAPAKTIQEASTLYPTLEINGIHGGYTGPGFKTVIPFQSTAYLSCRLVPCQNPKAIAKSIIAHLQHHVPPTLQFSYEIFDGTPGWRSSPHLPLVTALQETYSALYNRPCRKVFMQASIPVAPLLAEISQTEPVICGVSYLSDAIHAAEENFSLEQIRSGFLSICLLFDKLKEI